MNIEQAQAAEKLKTFQEFKSLLTVEELQRFSLIFEVIENYLIIKR